VSEPLEPPSDIYDETYGKPVAVEVDPEPDVPSPPIEEEQ
jgi:hypothetical protein